MKLTPELKEIALRIFDEICQPVDDVDCVERWNIEYFAERFLAALPNGEPVFYYDKRDPYTAFKIDAHSSITVEDSALLLPLYAAPSIPQDYKAQLAESQAREAKLLSVLTTCEYALGLVEHYICCNTTVGGSCTCAKDKAKRLAKEVLAITADATALNELIAKAGEVMRERCFQTAQPEDSYQDEWFAAKADSSARIRAIPGVTLEDLNHD